MIEAVRWGWQVLPRVVVRCGSVWFLAEAMTTGCGVMLQQTAHILRSI